MGNILEITESRPTVQITEAGNTLQVVAPNAIVLVEDKPIITVVESIPQVIVQSAGIQGPFGVNWRGAWDINTDYIKSDAVHYGGSAYYCVEDIKSVEVISPPSSDVTHWGLLVSNGATGINWRGSYSASASYALLDAVEYYGSSWICTAVTTGNAPPTDSDGDSNYWELIVATPFIHKGEYASWNRYNTNETVLQNGTMWRCKQDGTRNAPPERPMGINDDWEYVGASGGRWLGSYVSGTQYYRNELVEYEGSSYVVTNDQTGNYPYQSGWELVADKGDQGIQGEKGLQWKSTWHSSVSYVTDDAVEYEGSAWVALADNTNVAPAAPSLYWTMLASKGVQGDASTIPGPAGGQVGNGYIYNTNTSGGSSVDGSCRFNNNSDLTQATKCWLSDTDKDGNDLSDYILSFDDSTGPIKCNITFAKLTDNQEFICFSIKNITSNGGGWKELEIYESTSYAPDTTPFSGGTGTDVAISMVRVGDRGTEWQGDWNAMTAYYLSDAVEHNGSTWICIQEGTNYEPARTTGYWELLAEGGAQHAAGSVGAGYLFDTSTTGDPATGKVRLNTTAAELATEAYIHDRDINNVNCSSFLEWLGSGGLIGYLRISSKGDSTRWVGYEITEVEDLPNSVHKYTLQEGLSTLGNGSFNADEELVLSVLRVGDSGVNWLGEWQGNPGAYSVDDLVYYEGRNWICIQDHSISQGVPGSSEASDYWEIFSNAISWKGYWSGSETYAKQDAVEYSNSSFISVIDNNTSTPSLVSFNWDILAKAGIDGTNGTNGSDMAVVGGILMYAGPTEPDSTWLFCDGAEVNRVTYSDLFAVIGITYGSGNNISTFNLPNLQQKFPKGKSSGDVLGATGGDTSVTLTAANLPNTPVWLASMDSTNQVGMGSHPYIVGHTSDDGTPHTHSYGSNNDDIETYTSSWQGNLPFAKIGSPNPTDIDFMPEYITINYIIKAIAS